MAKKFMFVCVGLLALTIAFLLGAQFGRAEYVDHSATGLVAAAGYNCLADDGKVWLWLSGYHVWQWYGDQLPVPTSQVKFFLGSIFISVNNEAWQQDETGSWVNYGPPPGMGTATETATWGSIKAQFNK